MLYIPIVLVIIVLVVWFRQYEKFFFNKPADYPEFEKLNREGKPIFIAFGDSLTQGNMSGNWVNMLKELHPEMQFLNAGMNADLTYTLLTRIQDITFCKPHFIHLLIGSNDLMATLDPSRMKRYYELGKITQDANFEGFKENYRQIIEILLEETDAKIMVSSLPPITEDFTYIANQKADQYSQIVQDLAQEFGLTYLPLRETFKEKMPEKSDQIEDYTQSVALIRKAGFKKNILGQSWNEISKARKAKYLTDNIHLNDDGAEILANLIDHEIQKHGK